MKQVLSFFISIISIFWCADGFALEEENIDLRSRWSIYQDGQFKPFESSGKVIHFRLDRKERSDSLLVQSSKPFTFYINHQIVSSENYHLKLSVDSLFASFPGHYMTVTLYFKSSIPEALSTILIKKTKLLPTLERQTPPFDNFVQLAYIVVIVFFTVLYSIDQKGVKQYLNLTSKSYVLGRSIFKMNSKINILFVLFTVTILGLLALMSTEVSRLFMSRGGGELWLNWLGTTVIILVFFVIKLIASSFLSWMFQLREMANLQTVTVLRVWVLVGMIILIAIWGQSLIGISHPVILKNASILMMILAVFGYVFTFFRMLGSGMLKPLHLFSYFCTSEIAPILVFVKILFE